MEPAFTSPTAGRKGPCKKLEADEATIADISCQLISNGYYIYIQYQYCNQGMISVGEYSEEICCLSARNNLNESINQLIARYIGRLREDTRYIGVKLNLVIIASY